MCICVSADWEVDLQSKREEHINISMHSRYKQR